MIRATATETESVAAELEIAELIRDGQREVELQDRARALAMSIRQEPDQANRWHLVTEAALEGLLTDLRALAAASGSAGSTSRRLSPRTQELMRLEAFEMLIQW